MSADVSGPRSGRRRRSRRLGRGRPRTVRRPTGRVYVEERSRGPVWYANYRLPTAARSRRGSGPPGPTAAVRPPATSPSASPRTGYETRLTSAGAAPATLSGAWSGDRGDTFADAAAEYLRYAEQDRGCKPSTLRDYRIRSPSTCCPCSGQWRSRTSRAGDRALARQACPSRRAREPPTRQRTTCSSSCMASSSRGQALRPAG